MTLPDVCYASDNYGASEQCQRIGSMELLSPWGNRFLSVTGSRTLSFGHGRYGRPLTATAEFLTFLISPLLFFFLSSFS